MKKGFVPELEALRGVAALLVAFFHVWGFLTISLNGEVVKFSSLPYNENPLILSIEWLNHYLIGGHASPLYPGVLLFFVLSGFVLMGALERDGTAWRFLLSRLLRIYPAVFANILIFLGLFFAFGYALNPAVYSLDSVVKNLLLIHASINGVMWSLQAELLAAPMIFAGFLIWKKFGIAALCVVTLGLMCFTPWDPIREVVMHFGGQRRVGWTWVFLLGAVTYHLGVYARHLSEKSAAVLVGLAVIAFFFCTTVLWVGSPWRQVVEAGSVAVIIAVLAYGPQTWLNTLLRLPVLRFYGTISYSFYLSHPLILPLVQGHPDFFGSIHAAGVPIIVISLLLGVVSIAAITPLSALSYWIVEKPTVGLVKRLRRPRPSAPIPVAVV